MRNYNHTRRIFIDKCMIAVCYFMTALMVFLLLLILYSIFKNGINHLNFRVFFEITPPPGQVDGQTGGLLNAIIGTFIIVFIAIVLASLLGIVVGVFLAELSKNHKLIYLTVFINQVMMSTPSIVAGLFVYEIFVVPMGHFSALAASLSLAILAFPLILQTTYQSFLLVPKEMHESAVALGFPKWFLISRILFKMTRLSIVSGIILAIASSLGETAPLIFTSLNNQFLSFDLFRPMASLPITIYHFAMSPYDNWNNLAWVGALLISLLILGLSILTRTLFKEKY